MQQRERGRDQYINRVNIVSQMQRFTLHTTNITAVSFKAMAQKISGFEAGQVSVYPEDLDETRSIPFPLDDSRIALLSLSLSHFFLLRLLICRFSYLFFFAGGKNVITSCRLFI